MINRVYYFGEKLFFYSGKTIFAISFLKLSKTKTFAVDKTTYLKSSREKLMPLIKTLEAFQRKIVGCIILNFGEKYYFRVFSKIVRYMTLL